MADDFLNQSNLHLPFTVSSPNYYGLIERFTAWSLYLSEWLSGTLMLQTIYILSFKNTEMLCEDWTGMTFWQKYGDVNRYKMYLSSTSVKNVR